MFCNKCPSIHLPACLPACLSVCLSVCLYVSMYRTRIKFRGVEIFVVSSYPQKFIHHENQYLAYSTMIVPTTLPWP